MSGLQTQEEYEASLPPLDLNATNWVLYSSRGSKYAHAPNWSPISGVGDERTPACGVELSSMEPFDHQIKDYAKGKPPCPRCLHRLRHHLRWLRAWADSYANLTWPEPELESNEDSDV